MQEQAGSKSAIANVPIDFFWSLISDYERYPDIVEDVRTAKVIERRGADVIATFTARVFLKSFGYTIRLTEDKPRRLTWTLVQSDSFVANDGGWELEAIGPEQTRINYWMSIKSNLWLPKTFVNAAARLALPSVLKRWCDYAENEWRKQGSRARPSQPIAP
jgi:coenzyme Q-binding protein COQ10